MEHRTHPSADDQASRLDFLREQIGEVVPREPTRPPFVVRNRAERRAMARRHRRAGSE